MVSRGTYDKLRYKKIDPCKILRKINVNAYKVDFPPNLDICHVFNVSDLYIFHADNVGDESDARVDWQRDIPTK